MQNSVWINKHPCHNLHLALTWNSGWRLHAALPLGVGPAKLGLVQAVDALSAVLHHHTALAVPAAPRADTSDGVAAHDLPLPEPLASSPAPPPLLDGFLREDPLRPALVGELVVVVHHIWSRETHAMGWESNGAAALPFQSSVWELWADAGHLSVCERRMSGSGGWCFQLSCGKRLNQVWRVV